MNKQILLVLLLFCTAQFSIAQSKRYKQGLKVPHPVCKASGKVERARIPPPHDFLLKSGETQKCDIQVEYVGFTDEARKAFAYAVSIWESIVESDMPIRMEAIWSGSLGSNTLGSCGPEAYYSNFKDAPFEDRFYPVAIAEKIAKQELNGESRFDLNANFSKNIDWYYGTDLNCPDSLYDFVTVVLHEIGHGLGFTGFFFVDNKLGAYAYKEYGDASSFDLLVEEYGGKQLVDTSFYKNVTNELKQALESNALYANSPVAKKRNSGNMPRLYSPSSFDSGSSIYHLHDSYYPHGNENSLMTHAIGKGEAVHDPGPLTRGIMDDIGWRNIFIRFDPPKDMEEITPIAFNVAVESDYQIDSSSVMVIYSSNGLDSDTDTLALGFSSDSGFFSASLTPKSNTDSITYYVQASDTLKRVRTSPSVAPRELHCISFGPDNEKPVINHIPISYFLLRGEPLGITVDASDNMGIDTVYVEYSINDVQQTPFGLTLDANKNYSGVFTFDLEILKDGDKIDYAVFAYDESKASNSAKLPNGSEMFSFNVDAVSNPVSSYTNDFSKGGSDFVISDFTVYTASGFENEALHSPHPYSAGGVDNADLEYSTFLKRPIIIKEEGEMTYDEVVLVEPGGYNDGEFFRYDYVIVEASKDFGENWLALSEEYDATRKDLWEEEYNKGIPSKGQDSETEGSSEMFYTHTINLLETANFAVGDTVLIRFRLFSDPYAKGWGWGIDNLRIQQPLASRLTSLQQEEVLVYPNPFTNSFTVTVSAVDKITDIQIDVFDTFGQKVYSVVEQNVFGELKASVDISHLGSGMFLVKVSKNGKQLATKKLIKN